MDGDLLMEPRNRGQCYNCKEYHEEKDLTPVADGVRLCPTCHVEYMETQP